MTARAQAALPDLNLLETWLFNRINSKFESFRETRLRAGARRDSLKKNMALSQKNKRKITIGENDFYWTVRNQLSKDILRLTVMSENKTHSRLVCKFKYKDFWFYFKEIVEGDLKAGELFDDELLKSTNGALTPWLVRQVIETALRRGWKPSEKGPDFVIAETESKLAPNHRNGKTLEENKSGA